MKVKSFEITITFKENVLRKFIPVLWTDTQKKHLLVDDKIKNRFKANLSNCDKFIEKYYKVDHDF